MAERISMMAELNLALNGLGSNQKINAVHIPDGVTGDYIFYHGLISRLLSRNQLLSAAQKAALRNHNATPVILRSNAPDSESAPAPETRSRFQLKMPGFIKSKGSTSLTSSTSSTSSTLSASSSPNLKRREAAPALPSMTKSAAHLRHMVVAPALHATHTPSSIRIQADAPNTSATAAGQRTPTIQSQDREKMTASVGSNPLASRRFSISRSEWGSKSQDSKK
eukprot:TRINITY_DN10257_c0_g1_i1.p1 TRINITY_DN10257_c0_g1~~TRINITY_DN10257_c0_g1_i1.p1  ORF type:complete len:223 (+),score=65.47 TRINITY_DN10257_c0_g1_i1:252-920(+)